jgi:hypothetical protein
MTEHTNHFNSLFKMVFMLHEKVIDCWANNKIMLKNILLLKRHAIDLQNHPFMQKKCMFYISDINCSFPELTAMLVKDPHESVYVRRYPRHVL